MTRNVTHRLPAGSGAPHSDWLQALKVYVAVVALANLIWETLQLPLYTIWSIGTPESIAFAVLHCTAGDLLIAMACLWLALMIAGNRDWPAQRHREVLAITVALGVGYTIFSEWLNVVVRSSWAYSPLMPVVPGINTGLGPLLQWLLIPPLATIAARKIAAG